MKKAAILPVIALTVALIAAPVYAAGTSSPSGDELTQVTVDGKDVTNDMVYTEYDDLASSNIPEVVNNLETAKNEIDAAGSISGLTGKSGTISADLQKALDYYGSSLKPADLKDYDLIDISYAPGGQYSELTGSVKITMDDLASSGQFIIIAHDENGKWVVIDPSTYTFTSNGDVQFTVPSCSPFLIIRGSRDTITTTTPTPTATAAPTAAVKADSNTSSPQTGETAGIYLLLISAGLAVSGIVCVKRAMKPSEK